MVIRNGSESCAGKQYSKGIEDKLKSLHHYTLAYPTTHSSEGTNAAEGTEHKDETMHGMHCSQSLSMRFWILSSMVRQFAIMQKSQKQTVGKKRLSSPASMHQYLLLISSTGQHRRILSLRGWA